MNKRAVFLLLVLWLALRTAASAYYDPTTKSFLSRDPIREAGGINLYAYCENDPVGNFDPIGLADGPLDQLDENIGRLELRLRKAGRRGQRTLDIANHGIDHFNREVARIEGRIDAGLNAQPQLTPGEVLQQTALGLFVDPVRGLFTQPDFSHQFFWKEVINGEWSIYGGDPTYNPRLLAGVAGSELMGYGAMSLAPRLLSPQLRLPAVRLSSADFMAEARARLNAVKAQYGNVEAYGMATGNRTGSTAQLEFDFMKEADQAERTTYLYQKLSAEGNHLKFGITYDPLTRYTAEELAGGRLNILTSGTRIEMLKLERNLHETLPLGLEERQKFYIDIQVGQGLRPPWEYEW